VTVLAADFEPESRKILTEPISVHAKKTTTISRASRVYAVSFDGNWL
jgi:hypothetical protein